MLPHTAPHLFLGRRVHWTGMSYDKVRFPISLQSDFARAALGSIIVSSELALTNKKSNPNLPRHKQSIRAIPPYPEIIYPQQVCAKRVPTNPNPTHPHSCLQREWHEFLREKSQAKNLKIFFHPTVDPYWTSPLISAKSLHDAQPYF